jgi:hypothetical protein
MKRLIKLACVPIFLSLFLALISINVSASYTILSVQSQPSRVWGAGEQFEVSVSVADVSDLYGWELKLYYSSALLNGTSVTEGPFLKDVGSTFFFSSFDDNFNATHGRMTASCALIGNISGVSGNGIILSVAFKTKALGVSLLALSDTRLGKPTSELIPHTVANGAVEIVAPVHDLAVTNVTLSRNEVSVGRSVEVYVSVTNEGNRSEDFTVNLYANETYVVSDNFVNLAAGTMQNCVLVWNTTGTIVNSTYRIKAAVLPVPEETDLDDNIFENGFLLITPKKHDVAVSSLTPDYPTVFAGQSVNIVVDVINDGSYDETFSVTLYYDNATVGTRSITNLPSGETLNLTFAWDTAGATANRTYIMKAVASQVPGETNTLNNILADGNITVLPREELSITVTAIVPSNQIGQPVGSFTEGTVAYLKIAVYSNSMNTEPLLLTVNVYDAGANAIGVISFKGPAAPGETIFILGSPIPTGVHLGTATVFVNALTDWPHLGGVPYGPEKTSTFQIVGR